MAEPSLDCRFCERLHAFRVENAAAFPDWHNAPVPSFGPEDARLLVVGLAPGLKGANKTGRPFTGDYAGALLYATLEKYGFSSGKYEARANDGLMLHDCLITNAVRCVPPQNKPVGQEISNCRTFLSTRIRQMPRLRALIALGRIAHNSTLAALDIKRSAFPFSHGAAHRLQYGLTLFDSYHCSRYNTNTGRLTAEMFDGVFAAVRKHLDET
jgi:uracil-DNA glycosylase family 4